MEYMSVKEAAEKWNISIRRVQALCTQNRIAGATRIGNIYAIPRTAEKPKDARIKDGKYIKSKQ